MSTPTDAPTTVTSIGVVMFTVSDVDAAIAFYRDRLGWEVRGDTSFGENGEHRWVEVAPPGSVTRLALNPPMFDEPGGSSAPAGDSAAGDAATRVGRRAEAPLALLVPAVLTAATSLLVGIIAAAPYSPMAMATFIARGVFPS